MSKQELLVAIRESIEADRRDPEGTFQRLVHEQLIDEEGRPVSRERRFVAGSEPHRPVVVAGGLKYGVCEG